MSVNKYNSTTGQLELLAGDVLYSEAPVGTIIAYGGTTAPSSWMLCQGQAISRTNYADLFAVIGTSYGSGDGSTTFNLPDLREATIQTADVNYIIKVVATGGPSSGGSTPTGNYVTTDTAQTITGEKTFSTTANFTDLSVNGIEISQNNNNHLQLNESTDILGDTYINGELEVEDPTTINNNLTVNGNVIANNIPIKSYTYLINSNATLLDWVNNTTGNDYTSVFIAPGTYTVGANTFLKVAATTKVVYGAGIDVSTIVGVQIQGVSKASGFTLQDGCFYNCINVHDVKIHNYALYSDYDVSAWSSTQSPYYASFDTCRSCINIEIINHGSTSGWSGMDLIYNSQQMENISCRYHDDTNDLWIWTDYMHKPGEAGYEFETKGIGGYSLVANSSMVINCLCASSSNTISLGLIYNCWEVNNCTLYGYGSEYGAITNSNTCSNNYLSFTSYSKSQGGGHICYGVYNSSRISDCAIKAHCYNGDTATYHKTQAGYSCVKINNNSFYVDNLTADSCYADAGSSYPIADTPNGGFNVIAAY